MKKLLFSYLLFCLSPIISASVADLITKHHGSIGCIVGTIAQDELHHIMDDAHVKKLYLIIEPDDEFFVIEQTPNLCPGIVEIVVMPDAAVIDAFADDTMDFVYIADPYYDAVYIDAWMRKVHAGGFVAGVPSAPQQTEWVTEKGHLLTFIIPTYNRAHTIRNAIDSIYAQHNLMIPFEVVVTDDASTDNTVAILREYAAAHDNFRFYVHVQNGGASKARNTCVAHARGDLIFNLDSDNILEPNSVQQLVEVFNATSADVVSFGQAKFFKNKGTAKHTWTLSYADNHCTLRDVMQSRRSPILLGNYLFTKKSFELAGGYCGRALETWRFGFRQLVAGAVMVVVPNTWYWHCLSPDGKLRINKKKNKNTQAGIKELKKYAHLFTDEAIELMDSYKGGDTFFRDLRKFSLLA